MKKSYIAPALLVKVVQMKGLVALSLMSNKADNSDALVKENVGGSIWDDAPSYNVWDDEW